MGCTRSLLKIWGKCTVISVLVLSLWLPSPVWAAFASQLSLSLGEEYNDNIFFTKKKETDFVTIITPTLHLYYAPTGRAEPTFSLSESFTRQGETRSLGSSQQGFQVPLTPTTPFPVGAPVPLSSNLNNFISAGDQYTNELAFQGNFLFRPDISFSGGYTNTYTKFIDRGGSDLFHTFGIRGIYNWRQDHNLHAGYSVSFTKPRNGDSGVIHNFDFGDDYFTGQEYTIQFTPTLSLSASTGLSINTSTSGPRVANNSTITITKLWETASLTGGLRKGLTPSFGISGVSDTASLFTNFSIQLAERLAGSAG